MLQNKYTQSLLGSLSIILLALSVYASVLMNNKTQERVACVQMAYHHTEKLLNADDGFVYLTIRYLYEPETGSCLFLEEGFPVGDMEFRLGVITDIFSGERMATYPDVSESYEDLFSKFFSSDKLGELLQ